MAICMLKGQRIQLKVEGLELAAESGKSQCQKAKGSALKSVPWKPEGMEHECPKATLKTGAPPKKKKRLLSSFSFYSVQVTRLLVGATHIWVALPTFICGLPVNQAQTHPHHG